MRDKLPEEHHVIIAALPDMRAHFEEAALRSPDHSFVLASIAEDLRNAEHLISRDGPERHVERTRHTLIVAAEGSDYYPLIAHEFDGALEIALHHKRRIKGPGE